MLYLILLLVFLIQFLVILGALLLVIFTARPEVPISGNGMKERTALRDHPSPRPPAGKPPTPGKNASGSAKKPVTQVVVTRPPALVAFPRP